ncbi:hypothetical protein B0J13DRAFT_303836 [Dactylonectria estremocensis]|uniref:Uncharacterized protein n=1 Tax=Dactylonectria estremocensis TaxID=1079267 RepID=A0A9P9J4A4_9HYPO|nr:hypothetical protein B0J13DRAFT_303836 [Dactylonectria estremocensis]
MLPCCPAAPRQLRSLAPALQHTQCMPRATLRPCCSSLPGRWAGAGSWGWGLVWGLATFLLFAFSHGWPMAGPASRRLAGGCVALRCVVCRAGLGWRGLDAVCRVVCVCCCAVMLCGVVPCRVVCCAFTPSFPPHSEVGKSLRFPLSIAAQCWAR